MEDKRLDADRESMGKQLWNVENSFSRTLSCGSRRYRYRELYLYKFNPYIISLPDNLYYQSGDAKDDAWIYDVTTGLKPERENRYGSLKIVKTLQRVQFLSERSDLCIQCGRKR